jgi:hypothetical protein
VSENILEALVVTINLASMVDEVMPPYFESMDYCCKLKIMGRIILFVVPELMRC